EQRLHCRRRASAQARLADLRRTCLSVRDLSGRDFLRLSLIREPALHRGNGGYELLAEAGCYDHSGAALEVQAGEYGRAAALHCPAGILPALPMAVVALAGARPSGLRRDLRAGV